MKLISLLLFSLFVSIFILFYSVYRNTTKLKRVSSAICLIVLVVTLKLDVVLEYTKEDIEYIKNEIRIERISNQISLDNVVDTSKPITTNVPVNVNDGTPFFDLDNIKTNVQYHESKPLDELGRTTESNALIGNYLLQDLKNTHSLLYMVPSGWEQKRYTNVSRGGWLYEKVHLIPYHLTGNSYPENMITGTNYLDKILNNYAKVILYHVEKYDSPVRVRVTPVYEDENLLPSGIYIEAYSVEDSGQSIMINSYIPNRQPGIKIDYMDGSSDGPELIVPIEPETIVPRDNEYRIRV